MTAQRHIIKRQVVELQIGGAIDAQQLQAEVSRIYRQRIMPLIDRYCSELSAPELIHRIDSLELNIGTIQPQHLEEELIAKVDNQLRALLAEQITADEQRAESSGADRKTASHLELFSIFAQTGSVPWWADSSHPYLLANGLQYLMRNAPGPLRRLMQELAREQSFLQRIVRHFDDRLLANFAAVLAPSLSLTTFAHLVHDLVLVLQNVTSGAGQRETQLRHLIWGVILQQASLEEKQETTWPPFFQAVLIHIARERGFTYSALLSGVRQGVQQDHTRFQSPIGAIVETLYTELSHTQRASLLSASEALPESGLGIPREGVLSWTSLLPPLRALAARLPESNRTPMLAALDRLEREAMDNEVFTVLITLLQSMLAQHHLPPTLVPRWRVELEQLTMLGFSQARVQTLTEFLQDVLQQISSYRAGAFRERFLTEGKADSSFPQMQESSSLALDEAPSLDARLRGPGSPEKPSVQETHTHGRRREKPTRVSRGGEGVRGLTKAETVLNLTFNDAEELYIDNAGLVILHPFLRHFFERLELLADKQFQDRASRQRAIGLLQYAASEDASPPEYLLPLNKVLCGMELDDVFDFGPPITETEAEECTDLLTAVIANAPILKNMSINGLRGTFLLRSGVLSRRDGAWLLRVERETYDVVLDRFPWTLQWVKLPWMDAPLRVEW